MRFRDRTHAGRLLAARLHRYAGMSSLLVLGLLRGGVPVACEVARGFDASLDAFVVRKLGVPGHEELAMGALASGGVRVMNDSVVAELGSERRQSLVRPQLITRSSSGVGAPTATTAAQSR